ncbi:ferritin-like protein [Thermanaerovibrio velox DSM 12556]|uniref:Ferritin n=1 Tax=Thermanaerovibrio velox DSM 12556 TaxID=926567 RepID=H0UQB0_9BACT|nr:ferritin [Thermanaerovibrio velox]EHM10748.1 ferritin-like protein [Thermanaerovibrio velox DSM 12556]
MISDRMKDAINSQIQAELYSSYLYLSMAAHFESENLKGFAHWMHKQADEERGHAMKFFHYLVERGGKVELKAIEAPKTSWSSPEEVFEEVLGHERKVTSLINRLYELALEEKDYPSQIMLQWFISEQVEEEASAEEVLARLRMLKGGLQGLLMLDRELAQR